MKQSEIELIVKQILLTQQDKADMAANETVSHLFKTLDAKFDEHVKLHAVNDKKVNDALARIEPYIKKAEDDREFVEGLEERGKKFGVWGGIWLTFAAVIGSIYYGIKHIK